MKIIKIRTDEWNGMETEEIKITEWNGEWNGEWKEWKG